MHSLLIHNWDKHGKSSCCKTREKVAAAAVRNNAMMMMMMMMMMTALNEGTTQHISNLSLK
jgi:hypothetical protein